MTLGHLNPNGRSRIVRRAFSILVLVCGSACAFGAARCALSQSTGADGGAKMRDIKPFIAYSETFQWSAVPEILLERVKGDDDSIDYSWASDLFFEKEVWQLEFRYKNVRTIDVDYPAANGQLERKRVWYLVYSVTNTGERLRATLDEEKSAQFRKALKESEQRKAAQGDAKNAQFRQALAIKDDENVSVTQKVAIKEGGAKAGKTPKAYEFPLNNLRGVFKPEKKVYGSEDAEGAVRFVPRFFFASGSIQDELVYEKVGELYMGNSGLPQQAVYADSFQPIAMAKIIEKESRPGIELLDTTSVSDRDIKPGETVWGVATWVDVDPRIDRFAIYISGLTNALRWEVTDAVDGEVFGAGRKIERKTLKLNFINPGDEAHSGGKEIYNNLPGELDYEWVFM
ncbi:MAG: hypothetical protein IJU03_10025 [Thermoguttaceae bacterium]|nr:hypothetical protein [Thermoguttaceae bacterium]